MTVPVASMSEHPLFIGGEWVAGARLAANVNPSDTNDVVGRYAQGDASHMAAAVAAAKRPRPSGEEAPPSSGSTFSISSGRRS